MQQIKGAQYCKKCNQLYPDFFPCCPRCGTEPRKKKNVLGIIIKVVLIILVVASIASYMAASAFFKKQQESYKQGKELMRQGEYAQAQEAFRAAGSHEDARELLERAVKAEHYQKGEEAFAAKDYRLALEEFTAAGDYEDAPSQIILCERGIHFQLGQEAFNNGDADTAIAEFTAAAGWEGADQKLAMARRMKSYQEGQTLEASGRLKEAAVKYREAENYPGAEEALQGCVYQLGLEAMADGRYREAADCFAEAGTHADARKLRGECSVYLGKEHLAQGEYADALKRFETAKGYADDLEPQLENYILLCKAETSFASGDLNKGVEYFEQLPQSFKPGEFDIAARRSAMARIKSFAKLDGHFYSTNYVIQITGGGYIHSYRKGSADDQDVTIDCTLNPDGSLNIKGEAFFYYFNDLPVYGFGFKSSHRVSFEIENVQWVPSVHVIDEHTKIYFSNGVAKIVYSNSVDGKYPTSSTVTYNEKK